MKQPRALLSLLLIALLTSGASSKKELKKLAKTGDTQAVTERAIELLAVDSTDKHARAALELWAAQVFDTQVDAAREHDASGRVEQALDGLVDAIAFAGTVQAAGGPALHDAELGQELDDLQDAVGQHRVSQARQLFGAGEWAKSIETWQLVLALDPASAEVQPAVAAAHRQWGHDEVRSGHYASAIQHFDQASELHQDDEATAWAAAVHAAVGRYYLKGGWCRAATEELRLATDLPFDTALGDDLQRAMACAQRQIVVRPFDGVPGANGDSAALGHLLSDRIEHGLRDDMSEHMRLIDANSRQAANHFDVKGKRFEVAGHLTGVEVSPTEPITKARTTVGHFLVPCPDTSSKPSAEPCLQSVEVFYDQIDVGLKLEVAATLRVVDIATGEQESGHSMAKSTETRVSTVDHFTIWDDDTQKRTPIHIADKADGRSIALDKKIIRQAEHPPQPLTGTSQSAKLIEGLAKGAVKAVLSAVDLEAAPEPPSKLVIASPLVEAQQLSFERGGIQVEGGPGPTPLQSYALKVQTQIEHHWRDARDELTVRDLRAHTVDTPYQAQVRLTLLANGAVEMIEVLNDTGDYVLDSTLTRAMATAAPYPAPPSDELPASGRLALDLSIEYVH